MDIELKYYTGAVRLFQNVAKLSRRLQFTHDAPPGERDERAQRPVLARADALAPGQRFDVAGDEYAARGHSGEKGQQVALLAADDRHEFQHERQIKLGDAERERRRPIEVRQLRAQRDQPGRRDARREGLQDRNRARLPVNRDVERRAARRKGVSQRLQASSDIFTRLWRRDEIEQRAEEGVLIALGS